MKSLFFYIINPKIQLSMPLQTVKHHNRQPWKVMSLQNSNFPDNFMQTLLWRPWLPMVRAPYQCLAGHQNLEELYLMVIQGYCIHPWITTRLAKDTTAAPSVTPIVFNSVPLEQCWLVAQSHNRVGTRSKTLHEISWP